VDVVGDLVFDNSEGFVKVGEDVGRFWKWIYLKNFIGWGEAHRR
jgi:hypothetical protein